MVLLCLEHRERLASWSLTLHESQVLWQVRPFLVEVKITTAPVSTVEWKWTQNLGRSMDSFTYEKVRTYRRRGHIRRGHLVKDMAER